VPHGSLQVGRIEVVALCDAVVTSSRPGSGSYPGVDEDVWRETRERHPEVFAADGRWRFHVHSYVMRRDGRTFLMDTGIGPESGPAFAWAGTGGSLPSDLAAAGVDPLGVELVLISHVHDDHIGWNVSGQATPTFPNARYVIHRADWELMADTTDEEDREIFAAVLEPLERAGVLQLSEDSFAVSDELRLEHAPGHTPGHQVLSIDSNGARAVISGDLVNHPAQLLQPDLAGATDMDPERAIATRASWLERVEREDRIVAPAHFAEPFGTFARDGERRRWEPLARWGGRSAGGQPGTAGSSNP
jgi:glyoxylase-like metal-dependent hydrolase (beta-lactamase superfamily II)